MLGRSFESKLLYSGKQHSKLCGSGLSLYGFLLGNHVALLLATGEREMAIGC